MTTVRNSQVMSGKFYIDNICTKNNKFFKKYYCDVHAVGQQSTMEALVYNRC
jgi:hypothetical protein